MISASRLTVALKLNQPIGNLGIEHTLLGALSSGDRWFLPKIDYYFFK
jgi:hypothetical protein